MYLSGTDFPRWVLFKQVSVVEREGCRVDSFAEQPLDSDLVIVLVPVFGADQNLPHNQTPLGRREESVAVLDHKPAIISPWSECLLYLRASYFR